MVICEGAGSPAEINLLDGDIVNLRVACQAGLPAIVVGDIDRGGVFAALYGTVALLPDDLRATVRGFVINKFRGDPAVLGTGPSELADRTGVPTLGVLPWLDGIGLDAEDSLALGAGWPDPSWPGPGSGRPGPGSGRPGPGSGRPGPGSGRPGPGSGRLDVAAVRFPRISNFTDLDALAVEPAVHPRWVDTAAALGRPRSARPARDQSHGRRPAAGFGQTGLADAIRELAGDPGGRTTILGICGGYQMLGTRIDDPVESRPPAAVSGLGLLPAETIFEPDKVVRWTTGQALGVRVEGYEIRHGRTRSAAPWIATDRPGHGAADEGCQAFGGRIAGTSLHGLLEGDAFRSAFLAAVAARAEVGWVPSGVSFAAAREDRFDRLADRHRIPSGHGRAGAPDR